MLLVSIQAIIIRYQIHSSRRLWNHSNMIILIFNNKMQNTCRIRKHSFLDVKNSFIQPFIVWVSLVDGEKVNSHVTVSSPIFFIQHRLHYASPPLTIPSKSKNWICSFSFSLSSLLTFIKLIFFSFSVKFLTFRCVQFLNTSIQFVMDLVTHPDSLAHHQFIELSKVVQQRWRGKWQREEKFGCQTGWKKTTGKNPSNLFDKLSQLKRSSHGGRMTSTKVCWT